MALPLIENWQASALVTYDLFWIPVQDLLWVNLVNVTAYVQVELNATTLGRIAPKLRKIKIDFGLSDIYSKYDFHQWFLRQLTNPIRYLLENAIILFGKDFINSKIQSVANEYFENQVTHFPLFLPELNKTADMQVNWRMTSDPKIEKGRLDMDFWFDIGAGTSYCTLP